MYRVGSGRYSFIIKHPERILFPHDGITKEELIRYYQRIAPIMVPLIKDRPITMHRYPEGIDHEGFFQKNTPDYFPSWIQTVTYEKKEESGTVRYVVCQNAATLMYLASQSCITPHVFLTKADDRYDYPDRMIFDIDPSRDDFAAVKLVAQTVRKVLQELKLPAFVMTTGSRGLHVVVPLDRTTPFAEVRAIAGHIGDHVVTLLPKIATREVHKEARKGKVFVDILRNSFGQTGVAPYAVRARDGAPVATPLAWDELERHDLTAQSYTIHTIERRLAQQKEDPWKKIKTRPHLCSMYSACWLHEIKNARQGVLLIVS